MTEPTDTDTENERKIPDRNPDIACAACGRVAPYRDIKDDHDRDGGWRLDNDPEKPPLCPGCAADGGDPGEANRALDEF